MIVKLEKTQNLEHVKLCSQLLGVQLFSEIQFFWHNPQRDVGFFGSIKAPNLVLSYFYLQTRISA